MKHAATQRDTEAGWFLLPNALKSHYFIDGGSLCGYWFHAWPINQRVETLPEPPQDACKECARRLLSRGTQTREA